MAIFMLTDSCNSTLDTQLLRIRCTQWIQCLKTVASLPSTWLLLYPRVPPTIAVSGARNLLGDIAVQLGGHWVYLRCCDRAICPSVPDYLLSPCYPLVSYQSQTSIHLVAKSQLCRCNQAGITSTKFKSVTSYLKFRSMHLCLCQFIFRIGASSAPEQINQTGDMSSKM